MKYIKKYEIFGGSSITKSLLNNIKQFSVYGNFLLISIINNNYKDFDKYIKNYVKLKDNRDKLIKNNDDLKKSDDNKYDEFIENYEETIDKINSMLNFYSIEKTDYYGNTALLIAAKEGRLKMVKELIKAGANIYHTNNEGESFYDLAVNRYKFINNVKDWIEKHHPEVISMKKFNL